MCWSVWYYRTWSRWHLWLPIFTLPLGQEFFQLVCYMYVEKSQGQLCAYMYNSYNLKSNCTCLPLLQKWTSSEIIMKKFKFFYIYHHTVLTIKKKEATAPGLPPKYIQKWGAIWKIAYLRWGHHEEVCNFHMIYIIWLKI